MKLNILDNFNIFGSQLTIHNFQNISLFSIKIKNVILYFIINGQRKNEKREVTLIKGIITTYIGHMLK